jgi:ribonuclease E
MVDENEHQLDASSSEVPPAARRRPRRAASRPAGPPAAVEPAAQPDLFESSAPETDASTVEESGAIEAAVTEVETPTAQTAEPEDAEAEAGQLAPIAEDADDVEPVEPVETVPPARRSRRATRGVTTVSFSAEAVVAPIEAPAGPVDVPTVALFQPPDETKAVRARRRSRSGGSPQADQPTIESDELNEPVQAAELAGPEADTEYEPTDAVESDTEADEAAESDAGEDGAPRRRRRRGGRRRRRSGAGGAEQGSEEPEAAADQGAAEANDAEDSDQEPRSDGARGEASEEGADEESASSRRRRRRRRRAGVAEEMEDLSVEDPERTVVKVREGRRPSDEITSVRGSTRIEAKKQRRRDGREAGRRRAPILTEAEFLARRESVNRVMCVREHGDRTQIAVLEDGILVEHYVNRAESSSMVGNVYLGKVQNVLPSMEAAFVDVGRGRNAVLYAGEVNWEAAGLEGQPKRIELALKSGDPVLVQVTKDPIGHKGARLTSQISLPGRFLVYVPEGSMTGISRKLPDTERSRLKGILKDVVPEGAGVIVRTAAEGASEEQLTSDVTRLTAQWAEITKKAKSASPPTLLYGEPDLAIKVVRDIFNEDFTTLLVQGESTWATLSDYIGWVAPDLLGKLQKWVEPTDLYAAHRIDEQLAKALDRKVWLPSGGSLVIDRTEAMTVVDVNTGKFTGQGGNLEETVTRNNLEAAEEIVRQLRLRDIGGIIVVDFIDMVLESNRDLVLRRLVECLGRDRTKHQVAEVTSLGLVQMTRKRIGQGLLEVFSTPCEACGGRGHVIHTEPVGGDDTGEDRGRRGNGDRDRGGRRGARPPQPVHLGGKQTGKTPPPPKLDEHGHPEHEHHEHDEHEHHEHPEPGDEHGSEASDASLGEGDAAQHAEAGHGSGPEGGEPDQHGFEVAADVVPEQAAEPAPDGASEQPTDQRPDQPHDDQPAEQVEPMPDQSEHAGAV